MHRGWDAVGKPSRLDFLPANRGEPGCRGSSLRAQASLGGAAHRTPPQRWRARAGGPTPSLRPGTSTSPLRSSAVARPLSAGPGGGAQGRRHGTPPPPPPAATVTGTPHSARGASFGAGRETPPPPGSPTYFAAHRRPLRSRTSRRAAPPARELCPCHSRAPRPSTAPTCPGLDDRILAPSTAVAPVPDLAAPLRAPPPSGPVAGSRGSERRPLPSWLALASGLSGEGRRPTRPSSRAQRASSWLRFPGVRRRPRPPFAHSSPTPGPSLTASPAPSTGPVHRASRASASGVSRSTPACAEAPRGLNASVGGRRRRRRLSSSFGSTCLQRAPAGPKQARSPRAL